jgi:hypothetical protein
MVPTRGFEPPTFPHSTERLYQLAYVGIYVWYLRVTGLEPARLSPLISETNVSTNSTTLAKTFNGAPAQIRTENIWCLKPATSYRWATGAHFGIPGQSRTDNIRILSPATSYRWATGTREDLCCCGTLGQIRTDNIRFLKPTTSYRWATRAQNNKKPTCERGLPCQISE